MRLLKTYLITLYSLSELLVRPQGAPAFASIHGDMLLTAVVYDVKKNMSAEKSKS